MSITRSKRTRPPEAEAERATPAAAEPAASSARQALEATAVVAICILLALLLKLFIYDLPHTEPDEQVYWQLAGNLVNTGRYSLQGTEVLKTLSPGMYDKPLFHHPPLFPFLLVPFVMADAHQAAVMVPWLGHFLAIVAVGLLGFALRREGDDEVAPFLPRYWIPIVAIALDPILLFLSRRLWMDSLLAGFGGMAAALFLLGLRRKRMGWLAAGGVFLGLATMTKLTGVLLAPVLFLLVFFELKEKRERQQAILWGFVPFTLIVAPWFGVFLARYGVLIPGWINPDAWSLQHYPFLRAIANRPALYYFFQLTVVQPVFPLLVILAIVHWRRITSFRLAMPFVWMGLTLLVVSAMGARGLGFQMRHLCPMLAGLYGALYVVMPARTDRSPLALGILAAAIYGGATGLVNLVAQVSDLLSISEIARLMAPM
ncbi:MAG: phospholipid carrier-dependent glycosyltransferase [Thermoanaerobaculia bacterium]